MISQKSIQDVLDTARVEEVVEDFVSLKRRGANMIGLCPFHSEKTPSFSVSPSKNIFKCFGCGKGGGPVQFIMEHEQLTFPDAIRYLAKKYQITLEEDKPSEEMSEEIARREKLFLINEAARQYFTEQLLNTDLGRNIGLAYFTDPMGQLSGTIWSSWDTRFRNFGNWDCYRAMTLTFFVIASCFHCIIYPER